jgi:fatty acid desaturase
MGFSGIDAALIGAVPYFSANFLKKKLGFNISPLIFSNSFMLIAAGEIALIYSFFTLGIPLLIAGILMLLYFISRVFREYDWKSKGEKAQKLRTSVRNFIVALLLVMIAVI